MANEIWHSYDSASVLYAFVYRMTDKYIYDVEHAAFEAIGTWDDARADECDIAMTFTGDMHFANFPTVAAGVYYVEIRLQAGASPDTDDLPIAQGVMYWDGSAELNTYTLDADITTTYSLLEDVDDKVDIIDTVVDTIDTNVDTLMVGQNKTLNVYDEREAQKIANVIVE